MPTLISGISGVRGLVDDGFDEAVVERYVRGLHQLLEPGPLVLARDTRPSGPRFHEVARKTLLSLGRPLLDCGIVPTPTAQWMVKATSAAGGVIITASHNPIAWNALKFMGREGLFLDQEQHRRLLEILEKESETPGAAGKAQLQDVKDAVERHVKSTLTLEGVNPAAVRERRFKVVVDTVNGAAYQALPELLRALGCEVEELYCRPTGEFRRPPEPLPESLRDLSQRVTTLGADLGLATDPDGDRLALVDERGRPVGEENTIVLAAYQVLQRVVPGDHRPVVTNLSTTRALDDIAAKFGRRVLRTPVGEIHVARKMQEVGAIIGGEGNGGVIYPPSHYGRDSLVGSALVLSLLAETGKLLSQIVDELPQYVIVKMKLETPHTTPRELVQRLAERYSEANPDLQDGIKLSWQDRWVHVRASNTEPILRIFAEAPDAKAAQELAQRFREELLQLQKN